MGNDRAAGGDRAQGRVRGRGSVRRRDIITLQHSKSLSDIFPCYFTNRNLHLRQLPPTAASTKQGTVYLTIGYHQLEGKVQPLKKPLAVLSKVDSLQDASSGEPQTSYEVGALSMQHPRPPTAMPTTPLTLLCLEPSPDTGYRRGQREVPFQKQATSLDIEAKPETMTKNKLTFRLSHSQMHCMHPELFTSDC